MREDHDFLRAIAAEPEDDAFRLVYADWLEDRGEPDRAEFIRIQCDLAAMSPGAAAGVALRDRARRLRAEHEAQWLGPEWPKHADRWEFRRGLVESVHARPDGDVEFLLRSAPIRHLDLSDAAISAEEISALASNPAMTRLRGLTMRRCGLGQREARALSLAPHLAGLKALDLSFNGGPSPGYWAERPYPNTGGIGDRGVEALVSTPSRMTGEWTRLRALESLHLSRNGIGDDGARALLASPFLGGLRRLFLYENAIGTRTREALRRKFGPITF